MNQQFRSPMRTSKRRLSLMYAILADRPTNQTPTPQRARCAVHIKHLIPVRQSPCICHPVGQMDVQVLKLLWSYRSVCMRRDVQPERDTVLDSLLEQVALSLSLPRITAVLESDLTEPIILVMPIMRTWDMPTL